MRKRAGPGSLLLAAFAGASIWISMGALGVTQDGARIAAFAPTWIGAVTVIGAVVAAWLLRLPTTAAWPMTLLLPLWLPWVPISIPGIFLAFEGRLESIVWAIALFGFVRAAMKAHAWHATFVVDEGVTRIFAVVAFVCFVGAAALLSDRLPAGDEPNYLIITQSLIADGDLRIENNHARGDYFAYVDRGLLPDFLARGKNGEIYSVHAPGLPALLIPAFFVAGYAGAVVFIALICAVALSLVLSSAFKVSDGTAVVVAGIAVVFSPTMFFHSFTMFPDGVGAALVGVLVWWLVRDEYGDRNRRHAPIMLGAALSLLPWLHTRFALIAAVAGVIVVARFWRRPDRIRALTTFVAIGAVAAAAWLASFWIIYGAPDPTAPYGNSRQTDIAWIGRGLVGIFVDQQFGLVANAPIFAMVPYGLFVLFRPFPRLAVELGVLGVPYVLAVAAFGMWWGGESAPARFLTVLVPIAVPALASAWKNAGSRLRSLMVILALVGIANTVARVLIDDGALLFNFRDGRDRLLDWLSPTVDLTLGFPSVHRDGALLAMGTAIVWLALLAAGTWVRHRAYSKPRSTGLLYTMSAATTLVCVCAAFSSSARLALNTPLVTPASSGLYLMERLSSNEQPLIEVESFRAVTTADALQRMTIDSSPRPFGDPDRSNLTVIRSVPAGEYRVLFSRDVTPRVGQGPAGVLVGDSAAPIESWGVKHWAPGLEMRLTLPVRVDRLTVRPDSQYTRGPFGLQPLALQDSTTSLSAKLAGRFGEVRAFFFDESVFVEAEGVWTKGDSTTTMLITSDSNEAVSVMVRAGAAAVDVALDHGGPPNRFALQPNEQRIVSVASGQVVRLETDGGFRPRDVDPSSRDDRRLGVRLEVVP